MFVCVIFLCCKDKKKMEDEALKMKNKVFTLLVFEYVTMLFIIVNFAHRTQ